MRGSFDHHGDHADRQTDGDDDDRVFGDDDGFGDGDDFGDGDGLVMTHDHIWPDFPSGRVMSKLRPHPHIQQVVTLSKIIWTWSGNSKSFCFDMISLSYNIIS